MTGAAVRAGKRATYPAYKPSGTPWLGDVPAHWEVRRLKYTATINDEALPETSDPDYEFTYVDIGSVDASKGIVATETYRFEDAPSRARRIVRQGDTIVSTVRTYLRAIAAIREPAEKLIVSTGFAVVRPRSLDPGYLSYALQSPFFVETVVSRSTGVSYPAINAPEVGNIGVTLPPLDEQKAIAAFLDRETARIDALIEKKRRQIELLQEKRSALISHAVTKGLDPNAPMKDSGIEWLGQIPKHWELVQLRHLCSSIQTGPFGSQLHQADYLPGGTPVVNPVHLQCGQIVPGENSAVDDATVERLRRHQLEDGDLLFARRGEIGRCAIVEPTQAGWLCGTGCMRVRMCESDSHFYNLVFNSHGFAATLTVNAVGTTMLNINNVILARMIVPRPPREEQMQVVLHVRDACEVVDGLVRRVLESIERLHELRSALISAAVTGKIDVRGEVA